MGYLMPKSFLYKNSDGTIQPIAEKIYTFWKTICLKMNEVAWLINYDVTVQRVSHCATRTLNLPNVILL